MLFALWITALAFDGSVDTYVAQAVERHPMVKADFHRWQASVKRIAAARSLPEPTLKFAVFVRSVETRVGPQQARVSVAQAFPWPSKLAAAGKAATHIASAAERRLEATTLGVVRDVELAYWTLWELRSTRALHQEHLHVLQALSTTVASRIEIGMASLSDLQQVDLSRARLEDRIQTMKSSERKAAASLALVVGDGEVWPTTSEPLLARPEAELEPTVLTHPGLTGLHSHVDAAEAKARSARADRMPSFTVGADWILTGPAPQAGVADSGKDAFVVGAGVKIPLWQRSLGRAVAAASLEASARQQDQRSSEDRALAALEQTLADLADSERRATTVTDTLLPQAQTAYSSLLGDYAIGSSSVAQALLAQRDLLDLGVEAQSARADHQRAWAQLDHLAGAELTRIPVENTP